LPAIPAGGLKAIRTSTAYRGSRRIANGFCILAGAGAAIGGIVYFTLSIESESLAAENGQRYLTNRPLVGPDVAQVQMALWIAAAALMVFVISILIRQALIALLDIADCALKNQRMPN
jgi:hypothetical protein